MKTVVEEEVEEVEAEEEFFEEKELFNAINSSNVEPYVKLFSISSFDISFSSCFRVIVSWILFFASFSEISVCCFLFEFEEELEVRNKNHKEST